jgi:hypothetical protein
MLRQGDKEKGRQGDEGIRRHGDSANDFEFRQANCDKEKNACNVAPTL